MEENKTTKKAIKKVVTPKEPTLDDKIIDLLNGGFNVNQIGSMLGIHTEYIKQLINEKL